MRFLTLSSLAAAVVAAASSPSSGQEHRVENIEAPPVKDVAPLITVVQKNKTYAVKFECVGCPFGVLRSPHEVQWTHPPPDNSLMLMFSIDESASALLLNEQRVFPLDPMPLRINALQVPSDLGKDQVKSSSLDQPERIKFPLQYEHTFFRGETDEGLWLHFNVTGLAWGEEPTPFTMGQKVVQMLLREDPAHQETDPKEGSKPALSIADVQVVDEKNSVQPLRMKCGKLAMMRTAFDPNEWDEYGQFGTWARTQNLVAGKLVSFLSANGEGNVMFFPLVLLVVLSILMARCIYHFRQQGSVGGASYTPFSLLGWGASPQYTPIPVIKIEEYD
ncbi:hypothetical protein ACJQWK_08188 [Exserohilum turcicum]|uniref:DUF7728 domain-containing protein n=1 Tax=Exserohilum turcicum (strain 28A) TaxID=671987 RepID=R0IST8_EXST2|nr:uncharacterized protein SETTUDRAFT_160820 [Exserohilum turcica Et28A]EOA87910.1 hypothetical protein SETTUDRAFT_160820 [Exserohilum turcica Et28A]